MKRILTHICIAVMACSTMFAKSNNTTVLFSVCLHCQGCINKVEKNIAFEKGVKDLVCDQKKQTVLVTFDAKNTDIETLQKAFEKIGKPAKVLAINGKNVPADTDAVSAASQPSK